MERLVINIPDDKSTLVKQILKGLGVIIQQESKDSTLDYKDKLTKVSVWSDEDVLAVEDGRKSIESLKPPKW
jgi:hypothetical protein